MVPLAVFADLLTGATLGAAGGLAPGPLTALVISQTLRHGTLEGSKVGVAPLVTDGPMLLASAWLATSLGAQGLAVISLVGAVFLVWLGWHTLRSPPLSVEESQEKAGSVWKAVATNLFNPHPYVFWVTVGGPLIAQAESVPGFLLGFFGTLCGSKVLIAVGVGRFRSLLVGRAWKGVMALLGVAMWVFAGFFVADALGVLLEPS